MTKVRELDTPAEADEAAPPRSPLRVRLRATRLHGARPLRQARRGWDTVVDRFNRLQLDENTILLGFALAVGIAGALAVVVFFKLIDLAYFALYRWPVSVIPWLDVPYYRPLLTGAGFALSWYLVRRVGGTSEPMNVPYVQLAVARRGGDVPTRPGLVQAAASAVTLGGGGSAGSEGPVAVLGATVGGFLGRIFRFDPNRIKVLVGAGAAAGISASFNAPIAGAFFALEEILGDFSVASFPPVVVASVLAAVISRAFFGNHPSFPIPHAYGYGRTWELLVFYPLLGVLGGLVGALFVRAYLRTGPLVHRLPIPRVLVPWIGGALVGGLVLLSGGALVGYGHLAVRLEVFGRMAFTTLALLAVGKILATTLTLNTGGAGGVFTPSLYIGAATGGAFGVAISHLFPSLGLRPEAYALVGMGVMISAATHAPITAILIVFEMTNDYAIVMPLMLAVVVAYIVARRIEPESLYSGWLAHRGERIEHGADRDVLARLRVANAFERNPQVIGEAAPLPKLLEHLGAGEQTEFPVVGENLELKGIITIADLGRTAIDQEDLAPVLLAADLAGPTETVTPDDSLLEAMRRMGVRGGNSLPVVDGRGRLLGLITRGHILGVYERTLAAPGAAQPPRSRPDRG
ncbi:MAG TPA: chloride channel protein [Longimicrobiales bacterium]|nr:chloride channel protein [Longimicrobiales bacterium]